MGDGQTTGKGGDARIWWFAFGYFACYAPYSALAKALSGGLVPGVPRIPSFAILPLNAMASLVGMMTFITAMGWWKHARSRQLGPVRVPVPGGWTFLSGLFTGVIIATTTLAYTIKGASIVFMMLLMRGGVLVIAPLVDLVSRRRVRWFSWVSLGLSLGALSLTLLEGGNFVLTEIAIIDVLAYLASYFVRLRLMSRLAKSDRHEDTLRYFVEEQMVATPAFLLALVIGALVGEGEALRDIRWGFTDIWGSGAAIYGIIIGVLSQGTGIFGGLILLDKRENTFCVPVNRASSVFAGVLAALSLAVLADQKSLGTTEWVGAALMIMAMTVLTWPVFQARFFRKTA